MRTGPALIRLGAALALFLLITVLAGAASRARAQAGSLADAALGARVIGVAVAVAVALAAVAAVVLLVRRARLPRRRDDDVLPMQRILEITRGQRAIALVATLLVAGGVIAGLVWLYRGLASGSEQPSSTREGRGASAILSPQPVVSPTGHGHTAGPFFAVVVAVAVVAAALVVAWLLHARGRSRAQPEAAVPDEQRRQFAEVVSSAADELQAEPDPRAGIVACYRSMEAALGAAGVDRRLADTPEDMLRRAVRTGLALSSDADRLTRLFHEARFSTHLMGEADRDDAEAALTQLRAVLAGAP